MKKKLLYLLLLTPIIFMFPLSLFSCSKETNSNNNISNQGVPETPSEEPPII